MKPLISLSLDADNQWSYMKTHGDAGWELYPSYLDALVDVVLERLKRNGLRITFFVVGKDASIEGNGSALAEIAAAGHEIGNHSFHHEPWLHEYSRDQIDDEIASAETAIAAATGKRPIGFRGPGFSLSTDTLEVLAARGYLYDASTLPTFLGPLARAYYFLTSRNLSAEERAKRARLFGRVRDGLRPLRPYVWRTEHGPLAEIPVTTMPVFRVPMHLSYLIYLAAASPTLARVYLRTAVGLCRATHTSPSFLLHPLDFLGCDKVQGLDFFPGMRLTTGRKLAIFDEVLAMLVKHFQPVCMEEHARAVLSDPVLAARRLEAACI